MKSQLALKGIQLKKANEYLISLQQSLEQAGGLSSLWSERTARMTTTELNKLGGQLGINEEGEYMPLTSMALVTNSINKVFAKESSENIKSLAYKLTGEVLSFDQQVNGVWFDYAYGVIEQQGINAVAPTAEELKTGFVNGDYDTALIENYSKLKDQETNLLLSHHNMEAEINSPFIEGPMR